MNDVGAGVAGDPDTAIPYHNLGIPPTPLRPHPAHAGAMDANPGHRALRIGRCSIQGQVYLVTTTTAGRQPIFRDFERACRAARALSEPLLWRASRPLCWVLMPDHWHALIELGAGDSLAGLLRRLKSGSALRLRRQIPPPGKVWAKTFHDHALRSDEDLVAVARYIVANPLRAGLAARVGDYPFWDAVWIGGSPAAQAPAGSSSPDGEDLNA
ncbi:MAG TPA: transposase [Xanthomonadaceae bacterium]|nr:transposase [Xanthomonadaceae bacterium]